MMKRTAGFVLFALALLCDPVAGAAENVGSDSPTEAVAQIKAIEARLGGRLGVAALDSVTERRLQYRADERFPLCSTFKLPLVAAVLRRVDDGKEQLDRIIAYSAADLLEYAPVTREHVAEGGMTVEALCAAATEYSDNTAANLLLATMGGPGGLTNYFRMLGDQVSRLDRIEPALNEAAAGDERDTTSPAAMLGVMRALLLQDALTNDSRAKLEDWLVHNTTGARLIRAGVPPGSRVGDKTGRGGDNTINDVAIVRLNESAAILLCVYFTGSKAPAAERESAIAEVARIVCEALRKP